MPALKYGLAVPFSGARQVAQAAQAAEEAGWNGLFLGDAIWMQDPMVALGCAAMVTSRIRLGTMVTPAPIRVPWKLASEALSVDPLSDGRMTLGLGKGAEWMGWQAFPQSPMDPKIRGEMLDETIDILTELFQRKQFDYDGKHFQVKLTLMDLMHYPPKPVQQPRVPLWVVATWGRRKSMQRALKCDGILPFTWNMEKMAQETCAPADIAAIKQFVEERREIEGPYDYVVEGQTAGLDRPALRDKLCPYEDAGLTWWIEGLWGQSFEACLERIRQGAPNI